MGKLRNRKLDGLKFRRQYGIENYVIDFYCSDYKLAVELDGDVHLFEDNIEKDKLRQIHLEGIGIKFLRFSNSEVIHNLGNVLKKISAYTKKL